jgi:hypothetical protein
MTKELRAYCGLVCTKCPAYIAKRTNDDALRAKTAKEWAGPDFPIKPEEVNCDGCTTKGGTHWKFCGMCEVHACAPGRGVSTCAVCADYGCGKLEKLLGMLGPEARANLQALREG